MEENKVGYNVSVEDAVVSVNLEAKLDLVDIAKKMAEKSDNSVDNVLVKILEMAKDGLDWKGYAKEHLV